MITKEYLNFLESQDYSSFAIKLLQYFDIQKDELEDFEAAVGSVFLNTGCCYHVDWNTYCELEVDRKKEEFRVVKNERIFWNRIANAVLDGDLPFEISDDIQETIKKLKKNTRVPMLMRTIFNPFEGKFNLNSNKVLELNLYRDSEVRKKALEARKLREAANELYKNFDFFEERFPYIYTLIENLCVKPDRIRYFIYWLAYICVTLKKTGTAVVFKGIQGTGKGVFFTHLIQYFFGGKQFCPTLGNRDIMSDFTPWALQRALFVCFNEVKANLKEGNDGYEKLKTYVTDPDFRFERKNIDSTYLDNFFNCILFSNNPVPIQIQAEDRRYTLFNTGDEKLKAVVKERFDMTSKEYIEKLEEERDDFFAALCCLELDEELVTQIYDTEERSVVQQASDIRANIITKGLRTLDEDFFNTIAQNAANAYWNNNDMFYEIFESKLNQYNILRKKCQNIFELEDRFRNFFIRLKKGIMFNDGYAPVSDLNFIINLYVFDEMEGARSVLSDKAAAKYINGTFLESKTINYQFFDETLNYDGDKQKTRVRRCDTWTKMSAKEIAEETEDCPF